jgi:hypothetical protein
MDIYRCDDILLYVLLSFVIFLRLIRLIWNMKLESMKRIEMAVNYYIVRQHSFHIHDADAVQFL